MSLKNLPVNSYMASADAVLLIQQNLTPCAGQGINPLLTDGADTHTTPALLPRPLSVVGVVAAVAPVTPEATHVRAVLVEVRLPRGLRPRPARDMSVHRLWQSAGKSERHNADRCAPAQLKNREVSFLTRILGRMTPICFFFFIKLLT